MASRLAILIALILPAAASAPPLKVVTTTTDLEALTKTVAGPLAEVSAIAKGTQDPHQIEAKPSFMVRLRDADLVLAHGLELESAWIAPLIQGARNPKIAVGSNGYFELGEKLTPIGVPNGPVSRAQGDVHPGGNPHFHLDPLRLGLAAVLVADRLGELDPANRATYAKNAKAYQEKLKQKAKDWKARLTKTHVTQTVTYHKTLDYFFDFFGIQNPIQLEPRPGIPPTAAHLLNVIEIMRKQKIKLVLIENYFAEKAGDKVKNEVKDSRILAVPVSVGGAPGIASGEDLIERLVKTIEDNSK